MNVFYKMSASVLMSTMLLTGCSSLSTHNTVDKTEVVKSSQVAPIPQVGFRYSDAENFDLANEDKLSWRIFYDKPSTGVDAISMGLLTMGATPLDLSLKIVGGRGGT